MEPSLGLADDSELFVGDDGSSDEACIICLESIRRTAAVWSCRVCYVMMHLTCVQSWITGGVKKATVLSKEHFPAVHGEWSCPKCRSSYAQKDAPKKYLCFCGKTDLSREETIDFYAEPHSCGEPCERRLPSCQHVCSYKCHAGPCPECVRVKEIRCFCGQTTQTLRCSNGPFSCGERCPKSRKTCAHPCPLMCHEGPCPPCEVVVAKSCACGKAAARKGACYDFFLCAEECQKLLNCGVCKCTQKCHSGPCQACSKPLRCACGAMSYAHLKCNEPRPACKNRCGKKLVCGHICEAFCHTGPCPSCQSLIVTERVCRCGRSLKNLPCDVEFLCKNQCPKMRNCGKHRCNKRCCDGNCPPCAETCGQKLNCGNCKCEKVCHSGACDLCTRIIAIPCACSKTVNRVPCGRETYVGAPKKCRFTCSYVVCHHLVRRKTFLLCLFLNIFFFFANNVSPIMLVISMLVRKSVPRFVRSLLHVGIRVHRFVMMKRIRMFQSIPFSGTAFRSVRRKIKRRRRKR